MLFYFACINDIFNYINIKKKLKKIRKMNFIEALYKQNLLILNQFY